MGLGRRIGPPQLFFSASTRAAVLIPLMVNAYFSAMVLQLKGCTTRSARSTRPMGFLYRRTRDRAERAEHAAIARMGSQYSTTVHAVVKKYASVCWHHLSSLMGAAWADDGGLQFDHNARCLLQKAWTVMPAKTTSAGSRMISSQPPSGDNPTIPSRTTKIGVKQHRATAVVPIIPVLAGFDPSCRPPLC